MLKINDVCNLTGLTKKAIDYYQQKNIIDPKINDSGYREFNESEIVVLNQISVFRSLGLSVTEIKKVLDSRFPKEELKKCIINKQWENELYEKQTQLLKQLSDGTNIETIKTEIEDLNKNKSIKVKLLESFPGFYGRFIAIHFSKFLEKTLITEEQNNAYKIITTFLDEVDPPNISDEILGGFEDAMNFWTDEKLIEADIKKQQSIENPEEFIAENIEFINQYQIYKKTLEYQSSAAGQLMEAMKSFGKTSGYNDVFIPAMRKLSTSYEEYYQSLTNANDVFLKKFPEYK